MRRAWLLLALLAPAIASAAPSYYGWGAGAFLQGPEGGTCVANTSSPAPGDEVTISGCPTYSGTVDTLNSPSGDTISCSSGCTSTGGVFGIPAALTGFIAAGSMQDTEWGISGTWTVCDDSSPTPECENITLTIDPPGTTGPTHFFGTVVGPEAGDSVFPPAAAATDGDEYYVTVVSGSGVSVNTNGSTSASGDYEVNATIWDESDNGGAGRWSAVENTVFDATAPAFSSAAIDSAGTLFTLTMDEAVTQGVGYADSDLTLTCSGGAATLTYSAGDGTTTPDYSISRTIEAGETCTISFDGSANSLEDAVGNDVAAFTDESVTNNSAGDETAPTYSGSSIPTAGTSISVVFDENINRGGSYSDGDWTVSASGGAVTLTYSSGDGTTTLVLTTSRTIEAGETVTIAWAGTANGLEDGAGNDLAAVSAQSVTNNSTQDITAPTISTATVPAAGTTIAVTWDEAVSEGASYANGDWSITTTGAAVTVSSVAGTGTASWTLTLSRTIDQDELLTLDWAGTANGIEDAAGNDLAAFSDQAVTNSSAQDLTAPTVTGVTINGSTMTVSFTEVMSFGAGLSGGFALGTCSGGAVTPTYASGAGTFQLSFTLSRAVAAGETGCLLAFTQPTDGWQDDAANELATFTDQAVTIQSGSTENCPAPLPSVIKQPIKSPVRLPKCA